MAFFLPWIFFLTLGPVFAQDLVMVPYPRCTSTLKAEVPSLQCRTPVPCQRTFQLTAADRNIRISGCHFENIFGETPIHIDGAEDVLIENCTFRNIRADVPGKDIHAIDIPRRGNKIVIRNCTFTLIGGDGIQMGEGHDGVCNTGEFDPPESCPDFRKKFADNSITNISIVNNEFDVTNPDGGENGIDLKHVQGPIIIRGNKVFNAEPCIKNGMQYCDGDPSGAGIVIGFGGQNILIEANRIFSNRQGVGITGTGDKEYDIGLPKGIFVQNNFIYANKIGVYSWSDTLFEPDAIQVRHNTFVDTDSIHVELQQGINFDCAGSNNLFADIKRKPNTIRPASLCSNPPYFRPTYKVGFSNPRGDLLNRDYHLLPNHQVPNGRHLIQRDFDNYARIHNTLGADDLSQSPCYDGPYQVCTFFSSPILDFLRTLSGRPLVVQL